MNCANKLSLTLLSTVDVGLSGIGESVATAHLETPGGDDGYARQV